MFIQPYPATPGHRPTAHIKAMITDYEEVEVEVEEEQEPAPDPIGA